MRVTRPGTWTTAPAAAAAVAARVTVVLLTTGAMFSVWVTLSHGDDVVLPGVHPAWWAAVELVAAVVVAGAAVVAVRWRPMVGLALVLLAVLVPAWTAWPAVPAGLLPALMAAAPLAVVGVAQVTEIEGARVVVVPAIAGAVLVAVAYDPFADPACWETCRQVHPALGGLVSTTVVVTAVGLGGVVSAAAAGVQIWRGRARAAPWVRPWAATALVLLAVASVLGLGSRFPTMGMPGPVLRRLLVAAAAVLVGVAVLVVEIRRRRILGAVRRLADRLASPQAALVGSVVGVTGVDFAGRGSSGWVNAAGVPVPDSTDPCLTLADGPDPVARVHLARGIDADAVLAALTPSTRLALRNAQLLAVGRAQVAEVQTSRRRIVTTSDAERRRIERDLHDGAQQRLVSAALHLQVARSRVPAPLAAGLGGAEEQLRDALARLRRLAHGIFPAALAEDGLQAALDELATRTDVVLAVGSDLGADGEQAELGPDVELAAYATIADAVAAAAPAGERASEVKVGVDLRRQGAHLLVEVAVPAVDAGRVQAALVDAGDRVGALGGTLGVRRDGAGVRVKAVIPCVSSWPTT